MARCCLQCFDDFVLREQIRSRKDVGDCGFCGAHGVEVLECRELEGYFEPFLELYESVPNGTAGTTVPMNQCLPLWQRLQQDWKLFSARAGGQERAILADVFGAGTGHAGYPSSADAYVRNPVLVVGGQTAEAAGMRAAWDALCRELKEENRFFPQKMQDEDKQKRLLACVARVVPSKSVMWRTRVSNQGRLPPRKMGRPPAKSARSGRANPVGIPYLYLASDKETAVAEVRPSRGVHLTVGRFVTTADLRLADLTRFSPFQILLADADHFAELVKYFSYLEVVGAELGEPVQDDDAHLDYLPTQYLCEMIKSLGYEGVAYRSALGSGHNVALFGMDGIKCTSTTLVKVTSAVFDFEQT